MTPTELPPGLGRRRGLARLALWWEAVWPAIWPALGVLAVFVVAALLEVPQALPGWAHLALLIGVGGLLLWLALRAARAVRVPGPDQADRRLEQSSGLRHRPLAVLTDRPASEDSGAAALWQAHAARAAAQVRSLRVGAPHPGLPARDRRALRAAAVVALVAALGIAGTDAPLRMARAFTPQFAPPPVVVPSRLEAWVTPPSYTGMAPIMLGASGGAVRAPAGSRLNLAVTGAGGPPSVTRDGVAQPMRAVDTTGWTLEDALTPGRLTVQRDGREVVGWTVTIQADQPPTVAFSSPPGPAARTTQLRQPWQASDDWGLASLRSTIRLAARADAAPVLLDIPLPGQRPREARATFQADLTAHPWAGLPVRIVLSATDAAGQEAESAVAELILPERDFEHPVARALIAVRKRLSVAPDERQPAARELDRLTGAPEAFEHDLTVFLALRALRWRLQRDTRADAVEEAQATLWELALRLEDGESDRTARALAAAREALREALERAERGEADRAELERLMRELAEALERHMQALAEQLRRQQAEQPLDTPPRMPDRREMRRLTDRMEQALREDRREDARRDLAELERMLQEMEQGQARRQDDRERAERRQRGQQQMGALQDMVRRQSGLIDNAHRRTGEDPADPRSNQARPRPTQPPRQPDGAARADQQAGRDQDGRQQRALRRALGELMQQHGDLTGEVPQPLNEADRAMRESDAALRAGRDGEARAAQQRAIDALSRGGREMARQMARQMGRQPGDPGEGEEEDGEGEGTGQAGRDPGDQEGARDRAEGRDPLGRRTREGPSGAEEGSDTRVPDEMEILRSRRVQEELRRRGAERERPQQELDYIDRLLRRF